MSEDSGQVVVLLTNPRSGSSMITAIFAAHGFHAGRFMNHKGYESYEWQELKQAIRRCDRELRGDPVRQTQAMLRDVRLFMESKPRPIVIKIVPEQVAPLLDYSPLIFNVRRDSVATALSQSDGKILTRPLRDVMRKRYALMSQYSNDWIDADAVIDGDYSSISKCMDKCGVTMDSRLVDSCIDKSLWHYRKGN